jgi:hypothetical protein
VLWCLLAQGAILIDFCCPHVTWALPKLELRSVINLLPFFLPALAGSPFSGLCCHCLNVLWFRACHPGASCRGLAKRALVLCSSPRFVLPLNYVFLTMVFITHPWSCSVSVWQAFICCWPSDSECSYYMALLWFSFGSFLAETRMMVWGAVLFLVKRYAPNKLSEKQNVNWSKGLYVCNVQCATSMQHTSFPTFMPSTSSIIWFSHEICEEVLQSVLLDIIRWEIFWQQLQLPCLSTKDWTSVLSWSS